MKLKLFFEHLLKENEQIQLIKHHLDDIREALEDAYSYLEDGNLQEVKDNIIIIQGSSIDAEQIITGQIPQVHDADDESKGIND